MKDVIWTDDQGRMRRSLIPDNATPDQARQGLPHDAPNVREIDMESIFRDIEAVQYSRGLFDWRAVNNDPEGIQACINIFKRKLLELYRNQ